MRPIEQSVADAARADKLIPPPTDVESAPQTATAPAARNAPAAVAEMRGAYIDQAAIGYMAYAVGATSAFIAVTLSLSDAQAGLHASFFAAGIVVAGLTGDRLDRIVGARRMSIVSLLVLAVAGVLLAWAPVFAVTLAAVAALGLVSGVLLGHVNRTVSAGGGSIARVRLARTNLVAMFASLMVPLVIGLGESTGFGWQAFILPVLVFVGAGLVSTMRRATPPSGSHSNGTLPRPFWLAWLLVAIFIAVEFTTVVWGSSVIEAQVGVTLSGATLVLAVFIGGAIVGRSTLSLQAVSRLDPMPVMRAGIFATLTGSTILWVSTSFELSTLGLFLSGLGIGFLYPLGASIAIALAPGRRHQAATRLVLGTGLAILVAPLVLGIAADLSAVATAWVLVPLMCIGALVLTVPLGRLAPRA